MTRRYALHDIFETLQGEGARTGSRAIFVRFAGCNAWDGTPAGRSRGAGACARWCDTDFSPRETLTAEEILSRATALWYSSDPKGTHERWVVYTGGEPTLQLDMALVELFWRAGWRQAVETNGSRDPEENGRRILSRVDWITVSPKLGLPMILEKAHELKVVLPASPDADWPPGTLEALERNHGYAFLYVQPLDLGASDPLGRTAPGVCAPSLRQCIEWVKRHPLWRLSLQTHKVIGLP